MNKVWSIPQILLVGSIAMVIAAVVATIFITNTTLRAVDKNLPTTLISEMASLDNVLAGISRVVAAAEVAAVDPGGLPELEHRVQAAFDDIVLLRQTFVFDNLVNASEFHAIVAPAVADLRIWISEGVSGYGPQSPVTARIILIRISDAYKKADALIQGSRVNAQEKFNRERNRLEHFLSSVNLLFVLMLLMSLIVVLMFIRQHLSRIREIRAGEALEAQRELLSSLFENILLGITVWSREGALLFANQSFTRLTGYRHSDLPDIGTWFQKAYPDPAYRKMVREDWQAAPGPADAVREFAIVCRDSSVKEIEFRGTFLPDGRALVTLADITRQKQAEKALLQSEQKYRAVVENTPDLLYRTDTNGAITFVSSSVYDLSGYTVEEALGMKMAEEVYVNPGDRRIFLETLAENGKIRNFEARLRRKDGSVWWASTNAHFCRDLQGNITGVEGVTRDITERKQHEREIRESEQRIRAILEASPDPIVGYNREGHPIYMNPAFTEVFGWTLDEVKHGRIPFVPEEEKEPTMEKIREIYTHGIPLPLETRRCTKDGKVLDVFVNAAITKDNDGRHTGLVAHLTDVTQRRVLEAQYEHAQKMEALGTLAGGIAHDFNNLLGGIYGYMDLARKKTTEPQIRTYLTKAFNSSERARGLTRQLLTFSKGGAPLKTVESLAPFLREATQFALSGSNVSAGFDLPENLWMCDYDKNQIGQVIDNIVINAQHAMPSGGTVRVAAANVSVVEGGHPVLGPGKYVRISIADTGTGIPEKILPRIFDPFFTTKPKGSGLGLATSYSIVKRHGGHIDVASEPGAGATFQIFLPGAEARPGVKKKQRETEYRGTGMILIMDDEEMMLEMMATMLHDMGFTAIRTRDGHQALAAYTTAVEAGAPLRAVILDLTVPGGMGGAKTMELIRQTDADIPIFVASGYSEDTAIADPKAAGFTASLEKPFSLQKLSEMLETYLPKDIP